MKKNCFLIFLYQFSCTQKWSLRWKQPVLGSDCLPFPNLILTSLSKLCMQRWAASNWSCYIITITNWNWDVGFFIHITQVLRVVPTCILELRESTVNYVNKVYYVVVTYFVMWREAFAVSQIKILQTNLHDSKQFFKSEFNTFTNIKNFTAATRHFSVVYHHNFS